MKTGTLLNLGSVNAYLVGSSVIRISNCVLSLFYAVVCRPFNGLFLCITPFITMPDEDHASHSIRSPSLSSFSSGSTSQKADIELQPHGAAESTNPGSRSNATASNLDRVYSGKYPDDNAVYHSDGADISDDIGASERVKEVRNGVVTERDTDPEKDQQLIPGLAKLKSSLSERFQCDSKLVCVCWLTTSIFNLTTRRR